MKRGQNWDDCNRWSGIRPMRAQAQVQAQVQSQVVNEDVE